MKKDDDWLRAAAAELGITVAQLKHVQERSENYSAEERALLRQIQKEAAAFGLDLGAYLEMLKRAGDA